MRKNPIMLSAGIAAAGIATFMASCSFVRNDNLNQATLAGDRIRCDVLVSKAVDVNGAGMHAMKPIMSAAKGGSLETAKYLVSKGADVNAHNDSGSALMWAVDSGSDETVRFLLLNGADVNWTNSVGGTALKFALEKRATNIVRTLQTWKMKAEPDGAANGSQPIRSETNSTSGAAGSRR